MSRFKDLTGKTFGRLTVLGKSTNRTNKGDVLWDCSCECGKVCQVTSYALNKGQTKSCGCYQAYRSKVAHTKHGDAYNRLYRVWAGVVQRCTNPNNSSYTSYGGRGITMCEEWKDFTKFKEWAMSNGYSDSLSIERINVNLGYCPDNCTWIELKDQSLNKTTSIKYLGLCESEWSTRLGHRLIYYRRRHNVTLEQAVRFYICRDFI